MKKLIIRRNIIFRLFIYTSQFIFFFIIDLSSGFVLFKESNIYYITLGTTAGIVFLYSLAVNKIILSENYLIFDYHIWFKWRKQTFLIENIKSIRAEQRPRAIIVYVETKNPEKKIRFETSGFNYKDISHLISDVYQHPKNRIELSFS